MEVRQDRPPPVPQDRPFILERALDDGYRPGRKLRRSGAAGESVFERAGSNETLVQVDVERFSADRCAQLHERRGALLPPDADRGAGRGWCHGGGSPMPNGSLTVCGTKTKFNYCRRKIISYLQIVAY